jgi:hypothetical protein
MIFDPRPLLSFNLHMTHRLAAELSEHQLDHSHSPMVNPPRWILGHLAVGLDYALRLMGEAPLCPPDWHEAFGPGRPTAQPHAVEHFRPSKADLLAAIDRGTARCLAAAEHLKPGSLDAPHGVPLLANTPLMTQADTLAHLLCTHFSFHLGQLSAARRSLGFPPLF